MILEEGCGVIAWSTSSSGGELLAVDVLDDGYRLPNLSNVSRDRPI